MSQQSTANVGNGKHLVWLDCDPGHDDFFAILMCIHPDIKLLGISTVGGNQTVEKTTLNALKAITAIGPDFADVPVVKGQAKPMVRPAKHCAEIHGETGLDGPTFPKLTKTAITDEKAVNYMYKVINSQDRPVNLICTGQFTNAALLLILYPEIKSKIAQIIVMGGAIGFGNTSPAAEFNIEGDPEAASVLFESGLKVVMCPLEVTHTVLATPQILERCDKMNSKFGAICKELLLFFKDTYKRVFFMEDPPLHDPCTIAYLLNPSLFTLEFMRVDVECSSRFCNGRTVCDVYHMSNQPKNVHVATKVNVAGFWELLFECLHLVDKATCLNH
ncbi:hypothetical protein FDP41_000686 [Naegleria fowleri]|uniref:Inosine/uridine-preferring nucleoside hydrolase domain-containing protein n=1 Tax=Naegleria fowleri TaxID=5763 RepID=A0A6A5C667_NAEFO|nr:uncharacterized protein FDP41_000686 [Naegleria fowleri]KAF0984787.1 hypothetical protein FDP41_000686 [Naegleria fowleri]CAG4709864.1 unnamed protein product [Naegleria fowleri]